MINLLLGRPGAGKSYEAVVFHIIEAVKSGRKVITNIPLNLPHFEKAFGSSVLSLLEVREYGFHDYGKKRPFSTPDEYADTWRNQQGQGPLYVIDECHLSLPRGKTDIAIQEWFSLHRHYGVDVLLISQSYRKIDAQIVEMVEIVYRCSKARFLGFNNSYIRKTQDGVRGEVIHTETRKYKKAYFPFYKSHTQSNVAIQEAAASDVKPIYKQWPILGAAILLPLGLGGLVFAGDPSSALEPDFSPSAPASAPIPAPSTSPAQFSPQNLPASVPLPVAPTFVAVTDHPFKSLKISLDGYAVYNDRDGTRIATAYFALHRDNRIFARLEAPELELAGYRVVVVGECLATLTFGDYRQHVVCDAPRSEGVTTAAGAGDAAIAATTSAIGLGGSSSH